MFNFIKTSNPNVAVTQTDSQIKICVFFQVMTLGRQLDFADFFFKFASRVPY